MQRFPEDTPPVSALSIRCSGTKQPASLTILPVTIEFWTHDLHLAHRWMIARGVRADGGGGTSAFGVVFVRLQDASETIGMGEAAAGLAPSVALSFAFDATGRAP